MSTKQVLIIKTGCANLASVQASFMKLGATCVLSGDPQKVRAADYVVMPGVGSFGAGMASLREQDLVNAIVERVDRNRPTLAICLGMQLLCRDSEESPGVLGMGIIDESITRFAGDVRVPHMGWNRVQNESYYFANSYRLLTSPRGWASSICDYGGTFVAMMERGRVLACQFHPELSGKAGQALLARWLANTSTNTQVRRIIPCLDVKNGRVVKGVNFQSLRDMGDPVELAVRYESEGADEIAYLDIVATLEQRKTQVDTIKRIREQISIPLLVGGGVRSVEDAGALLDAGTDKVSINSAAVKDPDLISRMAKQFGSQCTVVAIDTAKNNWGRDEVFIQSGQMATMLNTIEWSRKVVEMGAGEILLTSIDRDGTRSGYDLKLLETISGAVNVPVIASGGAGNARDIADGFKAGASAVLAASIFHNEQCDIRQLKSEIWS